jgi:nitroimidazol reductase NimA-like FMN-containing flavoprotein (pyridoxamine 5'-phosphate oxidase superfamily)
MPEPLQATDRTRFHRRANRGTHDRATVDAILDEALICHVGFVADGAPVVIPTAFVRVGDAVYLHGSTANHMLAATIAREVSLAATLIDGLVLARTAFHHSMNYRSVVLFARGRAVEDPEAKAKILAALVDKMAPGRSTACRLPDATELRATLVVELPIVEAGAKIRKGPPLPDEGDDARLPYWAGVIPVSLARGEPIPA